VLHDQHLLAAKGVYSRSEGRGRMKQIALRTTMTTDIPANSDSNNNDRTTMRGQRKDTRPNN